MIPYSFVNVVLLLNYVRLKNVINKICRTIQEWSGIGIKKSELFKKKFSEMPIDYDYDKQMPM